MALPIEPTPVLTGEDAERLERDLQIVCSPDEARRRIEKAKAELARMSATGPFREALKAVPGVDAAFLLSSREGVIAVAREHGTVDRDALIAFEDRFGCAISIRAHQGRDIGAMFPDLVRLF